MVVQNKFTKFLGGQPDTLFLHQTQFQVLYIIIVYAYVQFILFAAFALTQSLRVNTSFLFLLLVAYPCWVYYILRQTQHNILNSSVVAVVFLAVQLAIKEQVGRLATKIAHVQDVLSWLFSEIYIFSMAMGLQWMYCRKNKADEQSQETQLRGITFTWLWLSVITDGVFVSWARALVNFACSWAFLSGANINSRVVYWLQKISGLVSLYFGWNVSKFILTEIF